jgi:hypothetical protein
MIGSAGRAIRMLLGLALVVSLSSCTGLMAKKHALPIKHTLVLDPLIVYSDFPLPPHHRLLDELVAERGELLGNLNLPASQEPVHVYLFDTESRFHGFLERYYPEFPQRRAFFLEGDTRLSVYAYWGERVAEDLRHEVAHGYLHAAVPGLGLWLDEGLAEYAEVPRGRGGLNWPHVHLLVERLANFGWRPSLERLERLNSATDMTQLDYAEAWAWVHWLMETGSVRREILQSYLAELRKETAVPPFSVRLRERLPDAERALLAHLQALAGK